MLHRATLALDLGTAAGWAYRLADGTLRHGSQSFALAGHEGEGARFLKFRSWLGDMKRAIDAPTAELGLVLWERKTFLAPTAGAEAAFVYGGFWGVLTMWCEHHRLLYCGIAPGTIKAAIAGKGNAPKAAVRARLADLGIVTGSHDESDAVALLLTHERQRARAAA